MKCARGRMRRALDRMKPGRKRMRRALGHMKPVRRRMKRAVGHMKRAPGRMKRALDRMKPGRRRMKRRRGGHIACKPPATGRTRPFSLPGDPATTRVAPVPGAARATAGNAALPLLLVLVVAVTLVAGVPGSRAAAAINPAQLLWLVKSNDLAELNRQAAADGVHLPAFTWVGCGGKSDALHCEPGQVPIFTSYWRLEARAQAGWRGTALFDIEPWHNTPAGQRHDPGKWICLAAQLQQTDPHLNVIITPFAQPPLPVMISEDAEAAKCGAYAVDVQSQFANTRPARFASFIRAAVRAIRGANPDTEILAGLATNNPNLVTAADMTADYHAAIAAGVQGFWLNANNWLHRNQCTAAEGGGGCPQTGIQFLEDVGMITGGAASGTPAPGTSASGPPAPGTPATSATGSTPTPGTTASAPTSQPAAGTGTTPGNPASDQSPSNASDAAQQRNFVRLILGKPLSGLTRLVGGIAVLADCGYGAWVTEDLLLGEVQGAG